MSHKVIIIDDDKINNLFCKGIIKKFAPELEVKTYLFAEEVLELIVSEKIYPDIILLDINMPKMNGWQFLDEFRKKISSLKKTPQIFMLSSSIDKSDIDKSKQYEFVQDYIVKPINQKDITKILNY